MTPPVQGAADRDQPSHVDDPLPSRWAREFCSAQHAGRQVPSQIGGGVLPEIEVGCLDIGAHLLGARQELKSGTRVPTYFSLVRKRLPFPCRAVGATSAPAAGSLASARPGIPVLLPWRASMSDASGAVRQIAGESPVSLTLTMRSAARPGPRTDDNRAHHQLLVTSRMT